MVLNGTHFSISDNSGAKIGKCIRIVDKSTKITIGSTVLVSIQKLKHRKKITKGSIQLGLVVETKQNKRRKDGSSYNTSRNSIVLLTKAQQPIGTRILGLVPYDVRKGGFLKFLSLAKYKI